MPFRTLRLQPGVQLEQTPTLNQTKLAASNLIRFYSGLVQKLGGWLQLCAQLFVGTCRGLHGWADIVGNAYLAVGTEQRLEVLIGGMLSDITPLVQTSNVAVDFSTVINTPTVTIIDNTYDPNAGDWINLTTQISVGGIVLFGFYQIDAVASPAYTITAASNASSTVNHGGATPTYTTTSSSATVTVVLDNNGFAAGATYDAAVSTTVGGLTVSGLYAVATTTPPNTFTITDSTTASSGATVSENGGDVQIQYLLPTGYAVNTSITGYGIGDYGAGDYGLSSSSESDITPLRQWSLDNWGQYLIASPSNGGIYYWLPPTVQPATVMPNAPLYSTAVFVMPQIQITVSLGAEISGTQEPLLTRWCDEGDFTDWTASATNQAGSYFYPTGSKLVGGLAVGVGALAWTDVDLWAMTYIGFPLVFGFNRISTACGLIAQRAAGTVGALVMWLSTRGFFNFQVGGSAVPMECSVWDFFINNVDTTQLGQIHCAVNGLFNEMAWHFPLAPTSPLWNALAPMAYVKVNYLEGFAWDYGLSSQYQRTAWTGQSPVGNPVGADISGLLQQHEVSTDANGAGMQWSWQTGYFALAEGEEFVFSDFIIPDMVTIGSPTMVPSIQMTDYPNGGPITDVVAPDIGPASYFITFSARGRQMSFGLSGSDIGTFNRLGAFRVRYAPDGQN